MNLPFMIIIMQDDYDIIHLNILFDIFYFISLFMLLGSSGASVEGYCAGEKELLDAVNRWVSVCPFVNITLNL